MINETGLTIEQLDLVEKMVDMMRGGMSCGEAASEISTQHPSIKDSALDSMMLLAQDDYYYAMADQAMELKREGF